MNTDMQLEILGLTSKRWSSIASKHWPNFTCEHLQILGRDFSFPRLGILALVWGLERSCSAACTPHDSTLSCKKTWWLLYQIWRSASFPRYCLSVQLVNMQAPEMRRPMVPDALLEVEKARLEMHHDELMQH